MKPVIVRSSLLFFLGASAAFSQPFSFGVRLGVPLTDFFNTVGSSNYTFNTTTDRYIVGPTAELHLPFGFGVEVDAFKQRTADALHCATHDLAFDQHRIDHHAAIMRDGVVRDLHASKLGIDFDHRGMHRIGPGDGRRFEIIGFLESGIDARRTPIVPARARRLRHLGERDFRARHADNADTALA